MHSRKIISVFVGLFFFYTTTAQPNDLIFKHITKSSGLPVDGISCLAQDSSGFIWIGSYEGLFRYDGFSYKKYNCIPGNPKSIPSNAIEKICVTRQGLLWIATIEGGVACMDRNGRIISIINSSNTPLFTKQSDYVKDIQEDANGNIWWATLDGLFRLSTKEDRIERFQENNSVRKINRFGNFIFDASGRLWGGFDGGLMIFDPLTKTFVHTVNEVYDFTAFKNKSTFQVIAMLEERLWYSTWVPDIGVYDTSKKRDVIIYSGKDSSQPDFNKMANVFYKDSKKNLWIGTGRGLFFTSNKSSYEKKFFHETNNPYSIINDYITAILEDREGNFWFGTKEGISVAQPYKKQITNLSEHNQKQFPFGDKEISDIIEVDSNTLLVCTTEADGIYETDLDFKLKKRFFFKNMDYDWIWTYYDDKPRHRIFISTQHGMLLYNTQTHGIKKIAATLNYNINSISSFVATSDSIVWMSRFRNSFLKYNLKNDSYKEYKLEDLGEKRQNLLLSKDKDNTLWIMAHETGIFQFDEKTEKIIQRLTPDTTTNSLLQTPIWFFKDLGKDYLIGYRSKGISLYNKKNKTYRHLSQADGLVSNSTFVALATKDDKAWIGTGNGLSFFDPVTSTFKNYGYENGILHNNILCIAQLRDGRIAAGTDRGVIVFNPNDFDSSTILHPPLITGINVYGRDIPVDSLLLKNTPLQISYKKNYVAFDFITPQYSNNHQIQYAYKLEGVDHNWIECGNRRFTSYSNIKGGHYFFKVKARMPNGDWVENKNYLPVNVNTAFYKQWWFYLICIVAASVILYVIFRYRLQQALRMERMRSTISGDLHDEVGASLTSISIFSEMAKKSVPPHSKEAEYLQRIGDRSRDSIEKMSDIIWSINPQNDNLQQMLIRMKNYASEVTEAKDLAMNWNEEGKLSVAGLNMEQRKHFYLVFKEMMNNVIKHAAAKNINIHIIATANQIFLQIKDDGKGFDTGISLPGNGLKSMQRRADLLNGNINISSEKEKGTTVRLEFRY
jgi:ligand-binding sensor domain-containing protein